MTDTCGPPHPAPPAAGLAVAPSPLDAYPPSQIARLVQQVGVKKATLPALQTVMLGLLAGAFIAFGAMYFTVAVTGSALGFGPAQLLGGLAFARPDPGGGRRRRAVHRQQPDRHGVGRSPDHHRPARP
jgi:hypothetical protein